MNVAQETLDFRCATFSVALSLLMPTSAFPFAPARVAAHLRPEGPASTAVAEWNAPLPRVLLHIHSFGTRFSPENYRRRVA